jgi:hypothetical protein
MKSRRITRTHGTRGTIG